ncbi:O-antigen ligase family protein [Proteus mirabilis]|nr:O-antigen ligase family protein [Proteus mirabilis]EMD6180791.1 O-antigen ligase family protein [Proteus mirabilis]
MKNLTLKSNTILYNIGFLIILMLCLYKPPFIFEVTNAVFNIISATIFMLSFIFKKIPKKIYILALILFSYFMYQLVFYGITASYSLIVAMIGLTYLISNNAYSNILITKIRNASFIYWSIIICVLSSFFFIFESHMGRYSTLNGDPNYTALISITALLIALYSCDKILKKSIVFILIFIILIATSSRTAIIGLLIFFIFQRIKKPMVKYWLFTFLFVFSITSQYLISNWFPDILSFFNFDSSYRLLNLNDHSNSIRIEAYNDAVITITSNMSYFLFNGAKYYADWNQYAINIPHNWFIQATFGYGLLTTITISIILMYAIKTLAIKYPLILSLLSFLIFFASTLSIYPLQTPLILILFFFSYMLRLNKKYAKL